MSDKQQILAALRKEFDTWEELLAGLSEAQITTPLVPSNLPIKDVMAHLRAWQQRSIARMEAALNNREPEFPNWPADLDPEMEGQPDQLNAWIYETNREKPWSSVHREWREGFLRFLELGAAVPEKDLLEAGRYPWLEGHPLALVLESSNGHHEEHLETVRDWLRQAGRVKPTG